LSSPGVKIIMNRLKKSPIVTEIKKEYLKDHLDQVRKLAEIWIDELNASPPFSQEQRRGWMSVYLPAVEQNPEDNNMIRKHLRSRTLWRHHTDWEQKLELLFSLINQVRIAADILQAEQPTDQTRNYTDDYLGTALWQGFELASGKELKLGYRIPDNGKGVALGAYTIETTAATSKDYDSVVDEHKELIKNISKLGCMINLVFLWRDIMSLQESMKSIANRAVKSNDILYPCRYCKHLWK
jgi:hypothetical protein